MPSPKKQELIDLLTLQSFKEECLAIISKYVYDKSEAESLYDITAGELYRQNADKIEKMKSYMKTAMRNKAEAYYKGKANSREITTNVFIEKPTLAPVFPHIEYNEMRKAIKQHRSDEDFKLFEMVSQGYSYKEIANVLSETFIKEGTLRKRFFDMRDWIKKYFDEK